MVNPLQGRFVTAAVLAAMIAAEWFALRAGTLGAVLIGVLIAVAVLVLLARADVGRIGIGAALASAFTLTWNGWFVGPVRPGDVLVLIALLCFAAAAPGPRSAARRGGSSSWCWHLSCWSC